MRYLYIIALYLFITFNVISCSLLKEDELEPANNTDIDSELNYKHLNNREALRISNEIGCISLDKVKNIYTAADLYKASGECLKDKRLKDASELYTLASVYIYYDHLRVIDETAYQAKAALILINITSVNPELRENLSNLSIIHQTEGRNIDICRKIIKIGKPNYEPYYMASYGTETYDTDYRNLIRYDIDENANWDKSLNDYLSCSL